MLFTYFNGKIMWCGQRHLNKSPEPPRWLRDWSICHKRKSWERQDCSAWRRDGSGETLPIQTNTWREGVQKIEPHSFQRCPVTKQEAMGNKFKYKKFRLNVRKYFLLWGWLKTERGCPGRLHPCRYSKSNRLSSTATCSRVGLEKPAPSKTCLS